MKNKECKFSLKPINMSDLKNLLDKVRPTKSSGTDLVSTKCIKLNRICLEPLLLNLINLTITTSRFPTNLKVSKIIPILKSKKPRTQPTSYRPINLLQSTSKLIERIYAEQINKYLTDNKLIPTQHHGGIKNLSTATATITLIDHWAHQLELGNTNAIIAIDQSAAYDIVDHSILLKKLKILGFNTSAIELFKSYLEDRQQTVLVDGSLSDLLHTGSISVVQGSILSCIMFLIYTLDLPLLLHDLHHEPAEELSCNQPSTSTYVDDWIVSIREIANRTLQEGIDLTMAKLQDYMSANRLVMNKDKTLLMVISKDRSKQEQARIPNVDPELVVLPKNNMKILGTNISNNLKWNFHISESQDSLLAQMHKRLTMLRLLAKSAPPKLLTIIANGIIMSKLSYGIELWGLAPNYLINKLQSTQLEACRVINGYTSARWNKTRLLKSVNWLSVKELIELNTAKLTHKILHGTGPGVLTQLMTEQLPARTTRTTGINKLGNLPPKLGRTNVTKHTYRYRSYANYISIPDILKNINKSETFRKRYSRYLRNSNDLPKNICSHFDCIDQYSCTN